MLTRIIVSLYRALIEVVLWLFLAACVVAGWFMGERYLSAMAGAMAGLIGGFALAVMFFGAFLVLDDIRRSVRALEAKHKS